MTIFPASANPIEIRLPSIQEIRDMLNRTAVMITAMVLGFLLLLALVAALVFLVYAGKSTEALTTVVGAPVVGAIVGMLASMSSRLKRIEGNGNGQ